jgi:type I restriction enzyme R subunit
MMIGETKRESSSRPRTVAQARLAERIYTAIKPHKRASEFAARMATVTALSEKIREIISPEKADIAEVLRRIGQVLDNSIEGVVMTQGAPQIDLSRIDFKALAAKFKRSQSQNLDLERLKAAIRAQLDRLIEVNETRVDFREKFASLIEEYNSGATQIEQLFLELLNLSRSLSDEEARHVREQLTEGELVSSSSSISSRAPAPT